MEAFPIKRWPNLSSNVLIPLAALILAGVVSGCAFSNISVALPTQPTSGYSGGDNRVVTVPKFIDQREIKDRIGMQKNGYGMDTANAVADQRVKIVLHPGR